jgi:signal transduction histidine kinase/CheY-like chemotaxis protein
MKIRSRLAILVLAAIAPVAIFAAITTYTLWELQRQAYQQRFLERVNALRLALDTELEGTIRTLRSLAESSEFDPGAAELQAHAHFERLTTNRSDYVTMGLTDADGDVVVQVNRNGIPESVRLDRETAAVVAGNRTPAISNLVSFDDDRILVTFVAVPLVRNGTFGGIVYAGIGHRAWHEFLKGYPIAERATLTLNDRNGRIITRTLNDERWAGKQSSDAYWSHTLGRSEGVFVNTGLEGQQFYSAFSRTKLAGWVLGTGVPSEFVESNLAVPTMLLALGVVCAGLLASLLAWFLGRRVADTITALAAHAKALPGPRAGRSTAPLPIAEAETIRVALDEAADKLEARERSLNEALEAEARSRAAAEHANQAKDEFLAMLGHELRNPLSAISAAVTVLDTKAAGADAERRSRDIVRRQLRHLTGIVNDLLDVSRLTTGKVVLNPGPLDLSTLARNVAESFRETGRCSHLTLETSLAPAPVIGDETRLEQVVGNLLDNAAKYTPAGGTVQVSTSVVDGWAELRVRDNGSGIAPDLLPHVFDLFTQGQRTIDRSQGGLGLGLTVVRRLIEMHGGTVAAQSEGVNRGTTFIVRLPLAGEVALAGATAPEATLGTRTIVLVEDNRDNRDVVATLLAMHGHVVTLADSGPAGVAAIEATGADIAIVDIGLPGFDGNEVARRVRAGPQAARVVLVALTGYGAPEDRASALAAGFDAFLVKPFDLEAFEALVKEAEASRKALAGD